jgi:hypothetical protein
MSEEGSSSIEAYYQDAIRRLDKANDTIEAQSKLIGELSEALQPFALVEIWDISAKEDDFDLYKPMPEQYAAGGVLRVKDFRKASTAWAKIPERFHSKANLNQ